MNIEKRIVSPSIMRRVTFGGLNKKKFITVHQTGNTSRGANAEMHARLQSNGNSRSASWHYQVDDKEAIQSFPHSAQCFAAGDGRGDGNLNSIHVEICINSDGDYKKAVENGAEVVRHIMKEESISILNVKQHFDWSRKNCPAQIRSGKDGIDWNAFIGMVKGSSPTVKVESVTSVKGANLTVDGYWGKETTLALQKALGTYPDGIISGQYNTATVKAISSTTGGRNGSPMIRALQKKLGVKVDGLIGPNTVRALQRYLGTPVDGIISRPSTMVRAMQRRLNAGTF